MKASDELSDEQVRQMLFDLEQAYNAFNRSLQHTQFLTKTEVSNQQNSVDSNRVYSVINAGTLVKILDCIVTTVNSLAPGFGFKKFSSNKM